MSERKRCSVCKRYLIAQNGFYLHPEKPCAGLRDFIYISFEVEDERLNKLFIEQYGKPEINDYELLKEYEDKIEMYRKLTDNHENEIIGIKEAHKQKLNNPIIKIMLKVIDLIKPK